MPVANCTPHSAAILSGGRFDPRSAKYGNLLGYYDANDVTTMFQDDGTATPATAIGDPVRRWYPKYGTGAPYFSTANLTNAPTLQVMAGTPLTGLRSDGTDDFMTTSSTSFWTPLHNGTGFTMVLRGYITDANPEAEGLIYDNVNGSGATPGVYYSYNDTGAAENLPYSQLVGTASAVSNAGRAGLTDKFPTQTPVTIVLGVSITAGTARMRTWSSVTGGQVDDYSVAGLVVSALSPSFAMRLFTTAVSGGFRAKMTLARIGWWSTAAAYEYANEIAAGVAQ